MEGTMLSFLKNPSDLSHEYKLQYEDKGKMIDIGKEIERVQGSYNRLQENIYSRSKMVGVSKEEYEDFKNISQNKYAQRIVDLTKKILSLEHLDMSTKLDIIREIDTYRYDCIYLNQPEIAECVQETYKEIDGKIKEAILNNANMDEVEQDPIERFRKHAKIKSDDVKENIIKMYNEVLDIRVPALYDLIKQEEAKNAKTCGACSSRDCERDNDNNPYYVPCNVIESNYYLENTTKFAIARLVEMLKTRFDLDYNYNKDAAKIYLNNIDYPTKSSNRYTLHHQDLFEFGRRVYSLLDVKIEYDDMVKDTSKELKAYQDNIKKQQAKVEESLSKLLNQNQL